MAVMATNEALNNLLETREEIKGATRDSGGVASLELMGSLVATLSGEETQAVLTQELVLADLGSLNSNAQDWAEEGSSQEAADGDDFDEMYHGE